MKRTLMIVLLFYCSIAEGQNDLNLVPAPAEIRMGKGSFPLNSSTSIVLEGSGLEKIAGLLNEYIDGRFGYKLKIVKNYSNANSISLNYERMDKDIPGAYNLTIDKKGIYIAGDNENGVFYGIQTLIQLLPTNNEQRTTGKVSVPFLSITDYPRFAYRGMHLDVGRHFFPPSFIKKYIDYLAAYKFNTFHWHLTEDQGWRIEIKKYPELTRIGAWRNGTIIGRYPGKGNDNKAYGGFYTQEEVKDIVKYAADRYITIIPEIEMPGHSSAAIAAYPWLSCFPDKPTAIPAKMISQKSIDEQKNGRIKLVQETWGVFDDVYCAGKDSTFIFLQNVIDEVLALFPSKYIHVGGDESPKTFWKLCPNCQARIKNEKLKDEHELQNYFISRMEKYINSKGRQIIGWDEILEGGLAPNATVMSWRGEKGGIEAARQKHKVIMTPGNPVYFDHSQSRNEDSVTIGGYNPIEAVYNYEPIPKELNAEEGKYVLGAQANMWTEYMEYPSKVEYMLFPRITALSEVLWSPAAKRNWKDFERRLPSIYERLDDQKINYSKAYYDLKATVMPAENYDGVLWKAESNTKRGRIVWTPSMISSYIGNYTGPIAVKNSVDGMSLMLLDENNKQLSEIKQSFHFNKATGKKITLATPPSDKYPGDGAFTLVNGVQNETGLARSTEFLGFMGTDMEAIIDLGKEIEFKTVTVNSLSQPGSWIYSPKSCSFDISNDGINFTEPKNEVVDIEPYMGRKTRMRNLSGDTYKARYIKVIAKNFGIIPSGNPGAGNPAWLFVDEIEVD